MITRPGRLSGVCPGRLNDRTMPAAAIIITISKNGTKNSFETWYTSELGGKESNFGNPLYQDIDGMLMEFTFQERTLTMKYSVSKVEKKDIPDSMFEIPADYKLTTTEELKSMFGGGM